MSYVYTSKDEEEYYTKWRKDLETNAYNNGKKEGEKNASIRIARKLAKRGVDINNIASITDLPLENLYKVLKEK